MFAVKEREDIVDDSDEEVGYEDDDNKSVVNEEYPIDSVVCRRIRRYMMHFEECFFLSTRKLIKRAAEKNCRWKKRPLMEATNFLNIRMKALMLNLQVYK